MSRILPLFLLVIMSGVATVRAEASDVAVNLFGAIASQATESGQRWQLQLRIPTRDGVPGRITASHLPDGAQMRLVNDRWVVLDWRPTQTQSGRYSLTLSAQFDGKEPATYYQVVDITVSGHTQPIRMRPVMVSPRRKANALQIVEDGRAAEREALAATIEQTTAMIDSSREFASAREESARNDSAREESARADNATPALIEKSASIRPGATLATPPVALAIRRPSLERMATRIVSVGRTVSFELRPTVAGDRVAAVHVDRLPRNASFERNPDGSRTFFWPTGHRDQGEHVFRFTANHPDDPSLLSVSEAVIIVGDPSQGGSGPR